MQKAFRQERVVDVSSWFLFRLPFRTLIISCFSVKKTASTVNLAKEQESRIARLRESGESVLPEDVLTSLRWQQLLRLKKEHEDSVDNRAK
jgi:hypothetical protein